MRASAWNGERGRRIALNRAKNGAVDAARKAHVADRTRRRRGVARNLCAIKGHSRKTHPPLKLRIVLSWRTTKPGLREQRRGERRINGNRCFTEDDLVVALDTDGAYRAGGFVEAMDRLHR